VIFYISILTLSDKILKLLDYLGFLKGTWQFRKIVLQYRKIIQKRIDILSLEVHYKNLILNSELVFDIGSNNGDYASVFLKYSSKVISIEPQKNLCKVQHDKFQNEIDSNRIFIENIAISSKRGRTKLYVNSKSVLSSTSEKYQREVIPEEFSFTKNIDTVNVETRSLDDLIAKYGKPNYIKIDIEGNEKEAFLGLSHPIPLISFECTLPYFKKEMYDIISILKNLGDYQFTFLFLKNYEFKSKFMTFKEIEKLVDNGYLRNVFDLYCILPEHISNLSESYKRLIDKQF
jgi:FkbM family methyltransferase